MKTLKTLSILFFSLLILSCSKDDDNDSGGDPAKTEFTATINGGGFGSNYAARLGSYSTDSNNGLTLAITDENANVIRFFFNQTGGFGSGITKIVGDVDSNGFVTNVIIRDQGAQVTYNSSEGEINILENRENPDSEDGRLISGNFTITATSGVGPTVTMTGNFKDFAY
ncbi:hypothetical protein [Aequorivita lipolytica]|uniref:Uncharacterized protein n=1 Tax=Aequorivita lipolytica TaxID=153267 RepID=A0A5C6YL93_9FLAO|nr:hypothetical protein [Aequorivita lipolytica]TXD68027.1 hypothetical protein ESV24_14040 [Aequorivita lipolytica]SRX53680.1 hypothetical protein AEQU2_02912 [Aequorivita lipolytica]